MNDLEIVKKIYGECDNGEYGFNSPYSYNPLLNSFGEILLKVDDNDYQGDSRVILKNKDTGQYGLLIFGWGSCSGCDALQSCNSYEEIADLRQRLEQSIKWMTSSELLNYFNNHDWEGDYSYHYKETREFISNGKELLNDLVNN